MAKSKNVPAHATHVGAYRELDRYAQAFADGHLNLLLLLGPPGVGKSQRLRQTLGANTCWIDGSATALGIYMAAYEHRNEPIVLDDVDGLYGSRDGVRLLKCLCQTDPVKTLSWRTGAPALRKHAVPPQFTTTSRVAIIANRWQSLNADVAALEDRAHVLHFSPDPLEVHREAARWFWDQEVFDFVGQHLHLVGEHSLRVYQLAWELKSSELDWRGSVLSRCLSGAALEVARLKADPSFASEEARVRAFTTAGHGSRATYFNHAKKLRASSPAPAIKLHHTVPPTAASEPDVLDLLRERFGQLGNG